MRRNDFVSNSSSSSFIVINKGNNEKELIKKCYKKSDSPYLFPNYDYKYEFGWEFEDTSSFGGKMNFIGIQLLEMLCMKKSREDLGVTTCMFCKYTNSFDECYRLLKDVCKNEFDLDIELDESLIELKTYETYNEKYFQIKDDFYIDHQSCVTENACMEMFDNYDSLCNFLSCNNSYIEGGNDNG